MGMPEWTLCADQKVYARLRPLAKPATRSVTRAEDSAHPTASLTGHRLPTAALGPVRSEGREPGPGGRPGVGAGDGQRTGNSDASGRCWPPVAFRPERDR
ncbi:hypothetical protein E1193_04410 [Micromonospora sp. KC606]|nr:hypothetical protein E1193_04410 [Micromonospora sp. KC606]